MKRIPVWFDTDLGVDDAVALLTLWRLPELELRGISAVAGNVELIHTYANARNICAFVGADYPVYKGADRPLLQEARTAAYFHGENGLGNATLPESTAPHQEKPAWDALYEAAELAGFGPDEVTITAEPVAAAHAVLGPYPADGTWIAFDLGGGTFDAALLRSTGGSVDVLGVVGDESIGGCVIDAAIVDRLRAAGRERAAQFTWERSARATLASYERALAA